MKLEYEQIENFRSGINVNNLVEAAETIQNALYPERREKTIRYMIRHLDHYLDYQRDYRLTFQLSLSLSFCFGSCLRKLMKVL